MKRILTLPMILLISLFITNITANSTKALSQKNEIINTPYEMRMAMSVCIKKSFIDQKYGTPFITREGKEVSYDIHKYEGGYLFATYETYSNRVVDLWYIKHLYKRSDFSRIKTNRSTFANVQKVDSTASLIPLNSKNGISEIRLLDGGILKLSYKMIKGTWVVTVMDYIKNDSSGFVKRLWLQDFKILK